MIFHHYPCQQQKNHYPPSTASPSKLTPSKFAYRNVPQRLHQNGPPYDLQEGTHQDTFYLPPHLHVQYHFWLNHSKKGFHHICVTTHFKYICCLYQASPKFSSTSVVPHRINWYHISQHPSNIHNPPQLCHYQYNHWCHYHMERRNMYGVRPHPKNL